MLVDVARRFSKDCHELGITVHGTFILGLPGETKETIEETIRFATEINPHTIQVSLAAPYPGTFLYAQAVARAGSMPNTPSLSMIAACRWRHCITRICPIRRSSIRLKPSTGAFISARAKSRRSSPKW